MSSIFLVGPMGAGKTTVGKYLADFLHYGFYDSDAEIEKSTGANIAWIFDKEGESGFRKREQRAIDQLTQIPKIVLATGGGAVISERNRIALASRGQVVYLKSSVELLVKRTKKDRNRPLLQTKDPEQVIRNLLQEREKYYQDVADLVIETRETSPKDMARKIMIALSEL